jgi:cell division septal protein FtsQ
MGVIGKRRSKEARHGGAAPVAKRAGGSSPSRPPAARPVAARAVRRRGGQARKPRPPLRQRLRPRLPSAARALAALGIAALAGALVAGLNGPWLRVGSIVYAGEQYTTQQQLAAVLAPAQGVPLLALDADGIAAELRRLPAVAEAHVDAMLPGAVHITVAEKDPAFVWQTSSARLVGAADGTLFGTLPADVKLAPELATLPFVDDRRAGGEQLGVGSRVPPAMVATALRLVALDPARLGSHATDLSVQIDDEYGFILVAGKPGWRAAFGFYGLDPFDAGRAPQQRIEQQVSAVRTLFAAHPEQTVSWVDARNPGKVYFRAKG